MKLRTAIALAGLGGLAAPALALTDAELEARLAAYEARIAELEARLARSAREQPRVLEEDLGDRLTSLERADRRNQRLAERVEERVSREHERFSAKGFASAGVAVTSGDDSVVYQGIDSDPSWRDTVAGLQFEYRANERVAFTTQLVGRAGIDNFSTVADYAYLTWNLSDDVRLRGGRMRLPLFMLSDYLEVGYTYPWARPPVEVYDIASSGLDRYEGVELLYDYEAGAVSGTVQLLYGRLEAVSDTSIVSARNLLGINATAVSGSFTFRAGYTTSKLNLTSDDADGVGALDSVLRSAGQPLLSDAVDTGFLNAGVQYDDGSLVVSGEFSRLEEGGILPGFDAWFLSAGYRFGTVMPYGYYADRKAIDDAVETAGASITAMAVGLDGQAAALAPTISGLEATIASLETAAAAFVDPVTGGIDPTTATSDQLAVLFNLEGARAGLQQANGGLAQLRSGAEGLRSVVQGLTDLAAQQKSFALGVRFDPLPNVAVKVQWDHVFDIEGVSLGDGGTGEDFEVFSLVIDTVF
jgi:hypothetical protein